MFKYFLLDRLRNKTAVFWILLFPLALMVCFTVAFGNLTSADDIDMKQTAVIRAGSNDMYYESFNSVLEELTKPGSNRDGALLFINEYEDEEAVIKALEEGDLDLAFKVYDDKIETLLPKDYSITACGVGKTIADTFMNNSKLINAALEVNPLEAQKLIQNIGESIDFLTAKKSDFVDESPNAYLWYYYSTFVMGILFNALSGVEMTGNIKADNGYHAMRVSVCSKKKIKLILTSYAALLTIALAVNVFQLFIMKTFLDVPLGTNITKLIAFVVSCNVFSIAFGTLCGCLLKGNSDSKCNKTTAIIMTSSFLSGEMVGQLPGLIESVCPIINDINPATIMNMAFFRLAYTTSDLDFYSNLIKIVALAVICLTASILLLRRERYASL